MNSAEILKKLPYSYPFLFVDELLSVDENGAVGTFIFNENLDFYKGHFKNNPVTPGVILTECMAQIGLVCLGIYLIKNLTEKSSVALTSTEI
jgi:3-hydroxyacyl-[acyl-carrier-protein] dehydratase